MASTAVVLVVVVVVLVAAPWLDEDESQDWLGRRTQIYKRNSKEIG
jgi:hypothetical protein